MEITGIDMLRTEAERKKLVPHKSIGISLSVKEVKKEDDRILIGFEHIVKYEPEIGYLKFSGNVYLSGNENEVKALMNEWKKTKQIPEGMGPLIIELISTNSAYNGVLVARAINLPAPALPLNARTELRPKDLNQKDSNI